MGLTVTAFVDGDVMSSATMTQNLNAIRNWMNGGIATGDIIANTVTARTIRKLEHRSYPMAFTTGVTGQTHRSTVSTDATRRVYATIDSHGDTWEDVSTMCVQFYAPDAGRMESVFEWWCWAPRSDQVAPELYDQCTFRLSFSGTAIDATRRSLRDAGYDATASDGGYFTYPARNFQALVQRPINVGGTGWQSVRLQINVVKTVARASAGLIIIGARNKHVEYWRK